MRSWCKIVVPNKCRFAHIEHSHQIRLPSLELHNFEPELYVPWSKVAILGIPPLIGNPYNGYKNPYCWVDDHPLLYGNNGSWDPGTYIIDFTSSIYSAFFRVLDRTVSGSSLLNFRIDSRETHPSNSFIFLKPVWPMFSSWWFQPIWKILVKMGIFPK